MTIDAKELDDACRMLSVGAAVGAMLTGFALDEHGRWCRPEGYPATTRVLLKAPTHWMPLPPPPGE